MRFACPVCKAKYDVPDNRIKPPGANLTCRKCATKIAVRFKDGKAVIGRAVAQAQPPTGASAKEAAQAQREEPPPEGEAITEKTLKAEEEEWEEPAEEPKKGGGEGAPSWVITFADMSTLMFAFFVLMLSFANIDLIKFREISKSMQAAFGFKLESIPGTENQSQKEGEESSDVSLLMEQLKKEFQAKRVVELAEDLVYRGGIRSSTTMTMEGEKVVVRVLSSAIFDKGGVGVNATIYPYLDGIAKFVEVAPVRLTISGHTDDRRLTSKQFPSNWELSTSQATTVAHYLETKGAPPQKIAAVGYSYTQPVVTNNNESNRATNQRVEFVFEKN